MLNDKVEVRMHRLFGFECRGLFAKAPFKAGEVIWEYKEGAEILRTYHKRDIDAVADPAARAAIVTYSYMLDDDLFGSTPTPEEDTSYYFNHSCAPNCWYQGDALIVAMRDIAAGEHLAYDYAFTESEGSLHAGLHCRCGAPECRGELRFDDWRDPAWRAKYRGHVTSYIEKKMAENSWYDPRIVLRYKGEEEKGLFATAPLRKGELVLVFTGKVVPLPDLLAAGDRSMELSLQVNDRLWQIPSAHGPETSDFVNHSCDANSGMEDSTTVVALRDIAAGEEVTIDYGTVNSGAMTAAADNFDCRCQAAACRGTVTSQDWKLPGVQQRYWPHFPPFVKRLILEGQHHPPANGSSSAANGNGNGHLVIAAEEAGGRGKKAGTIPSSLSTEEEEQAAAASNGGLHRGGVNGHAHAHGATGH